MKFTKNYSVISISQTSEKKKKQVSSVGAFATIKKALDQAAERVGSTVGMDQLKTGVTFYLTQRPKTRQGRLDWNKEVDKLSTLCKERMASYSPGIIVGRTGNQLELKQRRRNATS